MWRSYVPCSGSATRSTGLALLCTVLAQLFFTQQTELWSELVSWILLPVTIKIAKQLGMSSQLKWTHGDSTLQFKPSQSLWVLAISISISSFYKAENGFILLYVSVTYGERCYYKLIVDSPY